MQDIAKALTWTFIHSLWQGLLAALICAIIISSTRSATARLRYNLLSIVMILFFAGSVITFITQFYVQAKPVTTSSVAISDDAQTINSTGVLMDNFMVWVNANSDTIIVIWIFFFLLSCLRLVTGLAAVNRLKHYKTYPVTTDWKIKLGQLQLMIGVRCSVSLLQSGLVKVPMALGILKPVILLPLGLLTHLPPEQVETILLHELAHIRRRDYLVNLFQHIAEAIFFFNPAIRWISSLIRQEREASCDDMVVASCKQKTNYLNALINFQEYSFHYSSYAMKIGGKRHHLLNRVKRIITNKNKGITFFETIALLISAFLFSAFTYIIKETDTKKESIKPDSYQLQNTAPTVLPIVVSQAEYSTVKEKKITRRNKPVRDTVPEKKKAVVNSKNFENNKTVTKPNDAGQAKQDADATLQEIIQLKNQIGLNKESIGLKKEKLKTADGEEKEKILKELQKERSEVDRKRRELDIKRAEWDKLKEKAKERQMEEGPSGDKRVIDEKPATIKKNDAKQWDKSDEWDKSIEPDKSVQWDKSIEPDKSDLWDKPEIRDNNDGKKLGSKKSPGSTDPKTNNLDNNDKELNKQEFEYKMSLPRKDPPRVKQGPPPEPRKPATKAQPVKPATGN